MCHSIKPFFDFSPHDCHEPVISNLKKQNERITYPYQPTFSLDIRGNSNSQVLKAKGNEFLDMISCVVLTVISQLSAIREFGSYRNFTQGSIHKRSKLVLFKEGGFVLKVLPCDALALSTPNNVKYGASKMVQHISVTQRASQTLNMFMYSTKQTDPCFDELQL